MTHFFEKNHIGILEYLIQNIIKINTDKLLNKSIYLLTCKNESKITPVVLTATVKLYKIYSGSINHTFFSLKSPPARRHV